MAPPDLLAWMLRSTAFLGVWWGLYYCLLRRERSFAYNRFYLVLGPLLAAGLPLLPLAWPAGWVLPWFGSPPAAALPKVAAVLLPTVQVGATTALAPGQWPQLLVPAYLAGVALGLARLAVGVWQLWRRTRTLPRTRRRGYTLVRTQGRWPTSSFGRVVFWDDTQPLRPAEARQVLRHELAHVAQRHTLDHLLLAGLRAVLWFNPFVHLCGRALALTHEFLADAAAVPAAPKALAAVAAPPAAATAYARLLARQVAFRLGFAVPLAHSFSHSPILTRIAMLHQTAPVRRWKQWLILPLLPVLALLLGPVAQAQPTPPPAPPAPPAAPTPPPPPVVYETADQMPALPGGGGPEAIVAFIQSHLIYPKLPAPEQRDGRVFATFVVSEQGEAQAIKIVKGLAPAYDEAVLAALRQLPRFEPGRMNFPASQGGPRAGAVSYTVPLTFVRIASVGK